MKTATNKTHAPLTVPLPRGKTLHLGPGKASQVTAEALEHPPVKKLIEAGQLEISDDTARDAGGTGGGKLGRGSFQYRPSGGGSRRSGDR
jgi:hypothetical protein